ncbi:T9SS type A sorting domain-containing protein [Cytophagaceae bacterium DM2B3-1]|uniref:T9SS type A sorting domain-containing protein n=1 Tax=Xanthocytophaga flava TaxID=3048013 RepID=A0ABT7CY89_9BACT|nr:T9SS type A sorting domain-containing protein [Xanthocytophaga flavus]MDJ1498734.1 T9SS type A sorting domain-containing protein [Xanthocytophaga flavus]
MKHFYLLLVFISSFVMSSYGVNSPLLLAPQNGATINLNTLSGFNVNANEPTTWKLYIKVSINDPRQLVYEDSHTFTSTDQTTEPFLFPFSNGNPLEPNHQYLIELKTVDVANSLLKQEYFTFFTSSVTSAVQTASPLLVSPSPGDTLYLTGAITFDAAKWTVNANNLNARYISTEIFDVATGQELTSLFPGDPFPISKGLTAQTALTNVELQSNVAYIRQTPYAARMVLTTKDSLQNIIGQSEYPIIIKPRPLAADISITVISPVNGQTNVSTSPTITVQRPTGLDRHGITVSLYSYKIDKYPADNQGEDYRFVTLQGTPSISTWQIPGLKPATTYELEILYVIGGARGNPSGTGKTVKVIFTTAPAQGTNSLLLWPANNQSVTICTSQDVLVNANDSTARTLIVKILKNDPRQLVQDYTYALNGTTATQTISIAGVIQQLSADQQYLIEATTKNASGTILRQQYFTVFTTGCSQSAARIGSPEVELPQKSVVSPNPSAGDFQVQLHSGYGKAKVEIVSLEGRVIANYETEGNHSVLLNGSSLKPGLYLVRITGNAGLREQFKIVKQ